MTGITGITAAGLGEIFGLEIPESYVIVAKNSVLGMPSESICTILGCSDEQLAEVTDNDTYKMVRGFIAAKHSEGLANRTAGWNDLESVYLQKLMVMAQTQNDPDFILRAAAVANRAVRPIGSDSNVLEPSSRPNTTVITLTKRITERLSGIGSVDASVTRQISITDGSAVNPSVDEVTQLLSAHPADAAPIEQIIDSGAAEFLKFMKGKTR